MAARRHGLLDRAELAIDQVLDRKHLLTPDNVVVPRGEQK
jgi:hypothetical protein